MNGEEEKGERRVPTGITGLDKLIEGGFEEGSVNLMPAFKAA